ncbi:GYD domain-containing protein [Methylovirgula sp. 4M-Z18]|uniref:GYD domain-containing protein n=1 Tax=Methylovirgula sp. 4M-Z18 TaxID=2293567 RepID=UPI000E2F38C2|nr:GYD domain-containing protein [Methylovirgula sp. 4M-Z18]RFB79826.1 GYD domain-containing protein [Methylovirgula sp. 4M-Z18]
MAYYVVLINLTDQGVRTVRDTVKRADAFKAMAAKSGAKVHTLLWTLGKYDVISIVEAEDDLAATALSLSAAELGNVKTQTQRAFDADDMRKILSKMA